MLVGDGVVVLCIDVGVMCGFGCCVVECYLKVYGLVVCIGVEYEV